MLRHYVIGRAKEREGSDLDVVEVRGEKPGRTLILYDPCNKPGLNYMRVVETRDTDLGMFRYNDSWFTLDLQTGSDNPNGKPAIGALPKDL